MGTVSLGQLANPTNLRAFVDATSDITGASAIRVLEVMAEVLERQRRRRSDDMDEVDRLGRLLQSVRAESNSAEHVVLVPRVAGG